jgi:DNA-directed RNA polymerase subunit N (RpoN/RPB10)
MSLEVTKMRKVNFRMNELLKYETIKELVDYNSNKNRAVQNLGISRSQVDRLIIIYKEKENLVLSM